LASVIEPDSDSRRVREHAALVRLLRETIEADRFPLSPRIKQLTAIRDKRDPPPPKPEPFPPLKRPGKPSMILHIGSGGGSALERDREAQKSTSSGDRAGTVCAAPYQAPRRYGDTAPPGDPRCHRLCA
jgi:hypothetical protein